MRLCRRGGGSRLKEQYGTFSKFLFQFMLDNGLNVKELAGLLGVSPSSVNLWRDGRTVPAKKRREDIARKLQDLSANEFTASEIEALLKG